MEQTWNTARNNIIEDLVLLQRINATQDINDQDVPISECEDLTTKLGGVKRLDEQIYLKEKIHEKDYIQIEEVLYRLKSVHLQEMESILEKFINKNNQTSSKSPGVFLERQKTLYRYVEDFEMIEAICNSLTTEVRGDWLQTYVVALRAKPFL